MSSPSSRPGDAFGVSVADAVDHLRAELAEAVGRGAGHRVRFETGPVRLSLDVTVSRSIDAHGGVRFWVVDAGGGAGRATSQTHRIELELRPVIDGVSSPEISVDHDEGT